jgi:hypothetical protein
VLTLGKKSTKAAKNENKEEKGEQKKKMTAKKVSYKFIN